MTINAQDITILYPCNGAALDHDVRDALVTAGYKLYAIGALDLATHFGYKLWPSIVIVNAQSKGTVIGDSYPLLLHAEESVREMSSRSRTNFFTLAENNPGLYVMATAQDVIATVDEGSDLNLIQQVAILTGHTPIVRPKENSDSFARELGSRVERMAATMQSEMWRAPRRPAPVTSTSMYKM